MNGKYIVWAIYLQIGGREPSKVFYSGSTFEMCYSELYKVKTVFLAYFILNIHSSAFNGSNITRNFQNISQIIEELLGQGKGSFAPPNNNSGRGNIIHPTPLAYPDMKPFYPPVIRLDVCPCQLSFTMICDSFLISRQIETWQKGRNRSEI